MLLPDQITTAHEAVEAVQLYLSTRAPMDPFSWHVQHPMDEAQKVISDLDRTPGPGPVLRVNRAGPPFVVGRPKVPPGRSVHTVQLPLGPYRSTPGLEVVNASAALVEVATTVMIARALAVRAVTAAETEPGRPGRYLRNEATELAAFAAELEAEVLGLGAEFLGRWRTHVNYLSPAPPTPAVRSAALR